MAPTGHQETYLVPGSATRTSSCSRFIADCVFPFQRRFVARSLLGRPAPLKRKRQSELIEKHLYTTASTSESEQNIKFILERWLAQREEAELSSVLPRPGPESILTRDACPLGRHRLTKTPLTTVELINISGVLPASTDGLNTSD